MSRRRREYLRNRITGVMLVVLAAISFGIIYVLQHGQQVLQLRTTIRADFRSTSGLREGSPVLVAGVEVGDVSSVDFVEVEYACDPMTEDVGRYREGRTNNCDETLFCSPVGLCADLEPLTSLREHTQCIESTDCREDEVCITTEFSRRQQHVVWAGPERVCVRYLTQHVRVRAEMDVPDEMMSLIRRDSRAMVASASVLGDQMVNITPGYGEPLDEGLRVQAQRSLSEDIENWRERLDRVTENVEVSMDAVSEVLAAVNDPKVIAAIQGTAINLEDITGKLRRHEGLVGALIGEPEFKRDVAGMVRGIRNTTAGISGTVVILNRLLSTVSANVDPLLAETKELSRSMRALLADLEDSDNRSLVAVIMDERSANLTRNLEGMIDETQGIISALQSITNKIDDAEGTLGKLLDDPKVASDLARLLDRLEDHERTAALLRFILQVTGTLDIEGAKDPAAPPEPK